MTPYTLGLDIGSTSIGWAVILDRIEDTETPGIPNIVSGVRIFPEGVNRDKGNEVSKMQARRQKRQMRRQNERRNRRGEKLLNEFIRLGWLPGGATPVALAAIGSPYQLRKRGLDEELSSAEFARVLYHLNQRRGFRSARKGQEKEGEDGKSLAKSFQDLASEMEQSGARTFGEFLAMNEGLTPLRARKAVNLEFPRHARRQMLQHEFKTLWQSQARFHPDVYTEELRQHIYKIIFDQRPLKPTDDKIGRCELEPDERRCPRASWYAMEFRLQQEVSHLRIRLQRDGLRSDFKPLSPDERALVIAALKKNAERSEKHLRKMLQLSEGDEISLQRQKKNIKCNTVDRALHSIFPDFDSRSDFYIDEVWEGGITLEQDKFEQKARNDWNLSEEQIKALLEVDVPDGYAALSKKAIRNLLPHLEAGLSYAEARDKAGYTEQENAGLALPLLPPPPALTNPIVRQALVEVRKVVNALIKRYGKPNRIVVEMARETRGNRESRAEQLSFVNRRKKEKDKVRDTLKSEFRLASPSSTDILRYELWIEQNQECPYTGRSISREQLFSDDIQIDHILPYSRSLDDGRTNKVVCYRAANLKKGDKLPSEYFLAEGGEANLEKAIVRTDKMRMDWRKKRKFRQKEIDLDERIARQLNDTSYIAREVRKYLTLIMGISHGHASVNVTRGQITSTLRHLWGMNTILNLDGGEEKNRNDHRHHAVDAIVVALTTNSHLIRLSKRYQHERAGESDFPKPWTHFRLHAVRAINAIRVSYRPLRHIRGALHEETSYGKVRGEEGVYHYRVQLATITESQIHSIVDDHIRARLLELLDHEGLKYIQSSPVTLPNKRDPKNPVPIRRVRVRTEGSNLIPLRDRRTGEIYRYVRPGSNHHISVFEYLKRGKIVREAIPTTMFEAARIRIQNRYRIKEGLPVLPLIRRTHPEHPDARFLFSFAENELLRIQEDDGSYTFWRFISFDINTNRFEVRPEYWAGRADRAITRRISMGKFCAQKVYTSILGEVFPAND